MNTEKNSLEPLNKAKARTAFLLGWSVSQTLGLVRKGIRVPRSPGTKDQAPRLVVSDGQAEKASDAFVLSAHRIVQLYQSLEFESGENISPLTKEMILLPEKIIAWLASKSAQFYTQRELRDLLNAWSLQVWGRFSSVSGESARAFTAGMSLADTYWYLRKPSQRPKGLKLSLVPDEAWNRLLLKNRLDAQRSRLQSLKDNLPSYVVPVIRDQLQKWSIGGELVYQDDRLTRGKGKRIELKFHDEARLQDALETQMEKWEAMLFGTREATTYLRQWDWRFIHAGRLAGLFVAVWLTALVLLALTAFIGYVFATRLVPVVLPLLTQQGTKLSDWLSIANVLWSVLIAVPIPIVLRAAYQFTRGAQQWLDDTLKIFFIERRTYVPWNRYLEKR